MHPATEALIVIDIQNDFCPGGALAVAGGDEIVAGVNALMDQFPLVVLTQDWHPANHSSFAVNHPGARPFSVKEMPYGMQVLWPAHCVQDTAGAAFHPRLDTERAQFVVRKGFRAEVDSYSAFFENDHETPTGLEEALRSRGVSKVTLVGLATDYCVNYTALDAARLGFSVAVRQDLCRAIDLDGSLEDAREAMLAAGVVLE